MVSTSNAPSLADIATVTKDADGFGSNSWIWIIIVFALLFGWGGSGSMFGNSGGVTEGYTLASDFASLERQIDTSTNSLERKGDTINAGLCDGFYTTNMNMMNGFAGVNSTIVANGYETRNAITNQTLSQLQTSNAMQSQIADTNYNIASQSNGIQSAISNGFCQTNFNAQSNARDIVDSQNAGTQAILNKLAEMESSAKDDKIATLTAENQNLQLQASQVAQNQFIQNLVKPPINPAYITSNPYCSCGNASQYYYGTTVS